MTHQQPQGPRWWNAPPPPSPPYGPPPGYYYPPPPSAPPWSPWATGAALAFVAIGSVLQFQSVSLITGDSIYWIGAAIAAVGAVIGLASKHVWVKVVTWVLVGLCVTNIVYAEKQLSDKRHQLQQIVNGIN